jgi:hypothetical protein
MRNCSLSANAMLVRQYSITSFHDDSSARCPSWPLAMRLAAAAISLSSVTVLSPTPLTSRSRASGAWTTSANEPKVLISILASGLTSPWALAVNNTISSNS